MRVFQEKNTKWFYLALQIAFFVGIFILAIKPNDNPDTFYHVKAGQLFLEQGILHKDIFSFSAYGREWFPYEWLFEVIVYGFQHVFGYNAIQFLVASITTLQVFILFLFNKKFLKLSTFFSLALCFIYYFLSAGMFIARPQLFVMPIFTLTMITILLYTQKNRNFLWLTLPLTWIVANMHGSVIYNIYLFCSYAGISLLLFFLERDSNWLKKAKVLGLYALATIVVSILPPIGFTQYRLLLLFFRNVSIIQELIAEWVPIQRLENGQVGYYVISLAGILPLLIIYLKQKKYTHLLLLAPLSVFLIFPFIAYRNVITAYIVLSVYWAWGISLIKGRTLQKLTTASIILICLFFVFIYVAFAKRSQVIGAVQSPVGAANFLLQHHIQGNMFNEFSQGGYLIYRLYPKYKVFIDLRVDTYLCCELPLFQKVVNNFSLPDKEYDTTLTKSVLDPYTISFAVLSIQEKPEKTAIVLASDPDWNLVYWDDVEIILVRKNGKNEALLKQFSTTAATPLGTNPVMSNDLTQALKEYRRMIAIADSARSRNALGYIYIKQKKYTEAKKEFEKAIILDPTFDSPYANLAEIALYNGDSTQGISLYEQARVVNPYRTYIYLRLAQLYIKYQQDNQKAQEILQEGLQNALNEKDKKSLQKALSEMQNL